MEQRLRGVAASVFAVIALTITEGCARPRPRQPAARAPDATPTPFTITAYCTGTTTAAGTRVTHGVVAADPSVVPIGTVIRLGGLGSRYDGMYTVMDTGSKIRGRRIDLYLNNCPEAVRFGRRSGHVSVVR
jgi:3D (Asp-Asp-Asp) domain-containing protein